MAKTETDLRKLFGDVVVEQALRAAQAEPARIVRPYDGSANICLADGEWYAITVSGRQHKRARDEIGALGYVPYIPIEIVPKMAGRAVRHVESPMFGAYMFVRCPGTPIVFSQIARARGVGDIVRTEGQAPRPINVGAIEAIRLYEAKLAAADMAARTRAGMVWTFSAGDEVRIKTGPFADLYARLESAVDHRDRIKAVVGPFGSVELSAFDIEAV